MVHTNIIPPIYEDDSLDVNNRVYHSSSSYSLVVDDVAHYLQTIKEYLVTVNGVLLNSSITTASDYSYGSLYFKVPIASFNEVNNKIVKSAKTVMSETVNSRDITNQQVSNNDNLQSLKDSKTVKETELKEAKTESEKTRLKLDIERLEKQIKYAQQSVDRVEQEIEYANVLLDISDSTRYFNPDAKLSTKEEFVKAWQSLLTSMKAVFYFFIWIVVYSIVWLPIVLLFSWLVRKINTKKKS